jgi:hypothetical protein
MDLGTPELRQHGDYVEMMTDRAGIMRLHNKTADQLQTYFRRKSIERRHWLAGDLFQGDFARAGMGPNYATMDLDRVRVDQSSAGSDTVHIARERIVVALRYVGKPLSDLLVHVCGHGFNAGSWGMIKDAGRPDRDGMVALRLALSSLADHYKLT